jgi:enterochelin esterase family protein
MHVYTPPGYGGGKRYPVVCLFHGGGDQDDGWVNKGNMNFIMDNLIAEGKAKEMVVVMPYGHAAYGAIARPGGADSDHKAYAADLLETVIPFVESHYRVRANRQNRAVVGLSMGGGHALRIGLNNLDTFSEIAAFSSAAAQDPESAYAGALEDVESANEQLDFFWIGCGRDDRLLPRSRKLTEVLTEQGVEHTYVETHGAHTWEVWRRYLNDVAPMLFR